MSFQMQLGDLRVRHSLSHLWRTGDLRLSERPNLDNTVGDSAGRFRNQLDRFS